MLRPTASHQKTNCAECEKLYKANVQLRERNFQQLKDLKKLDEQAQKTAQDNLNLLKQMVKKLKP